MRLRKLTEVFSDDRACRSGIRAYSGNTGNLPYGESYAGKNQKAFLVYDSSDDSTNAFPRWGQWT